MKKSFTTTLDDSRLMASERKLVKIYDAYPLKQRRVFLRIAVLMGQQIMDKKPLAENS